MRADLVTYFSLPFYRAMIERSGFGEDIAAFDAGMQAGDVERGEAGDLRPLPGALTAIGSPEDVRAGVERYREAGATSPCIGAVPGTDFEATLGAAAARRGTKENVASWTVVPYLGIRHGWRDSSQQDPHQPHRLRRAFAAARTHPGPLPPGSAEASVLCSGPWARAATRLGHVIAREPLRGRPRPADLRPAGVRHRRCNFRCQYCMPAEGLPWLDRSEILTFEEIERLVAACWPRWASPTSASPAASRWCGASSATLVAMLSRDRRRRRPLADDQRLPARADGRRARRRGAAAHQRVARLALPRPVLPDDPPRRAAAGAARPRGAGALSRSSARSRSTAWRCGASPRTR